MIKKVFPILGLSIFSSMLGAGGALVADLEVDLWTDSAPPDAGMARTDTNGIATFHVPPGEYRIGFISANFPLDRFVYPSSRIAALSEILTGF